MHLWMASNFPPRVMPLTKGFLILSVLLSSALNAHTGSQAQVQTNTDAPPPSYNVSPYRAIYNAYRSGNKLGIAEQTLSQTSAHQYQMYYKSDLSILFLSDTREETSKFFYDGDKLLPIRYQYRRTGTGSDKALDVRFDTANKTMVIGNEKAQPWSGELDNQIYAIKVKANLASGDAQSQYQMINSRGQFREYGVDVLGKEILTLPYGKLETVKTKVIRDSKKRETFIWFAPELDYAMVRLQQFKKGKEQGDIRLKSFDLTSPQSTDPQQVH